MKYSQSDFESITKSVKNSANTTVEVLTKVFNTDPLVLTQKEKLMKSIANLEAHKITMNSLINSLAKLAGQNEKYQGNA